MFLNDTAGVVRVHSGGHIVARLSAVLRDVDCSAGALGDFLKSIQQSVNKYIQNTADL